MQSVLRAAVALALGLWSGLAVATAYRVKPGQSLADVAADLYGNAAYELVIAKHNRIEVKASGTPVAAGTELKVPEFKQLLHDEGLAKALSRHIDDVLDARYTYMRHRQAIVRAVDEDGPQAKLNEKVAAELRAAAKKLEAAAKALAKKGKHGDSPTRMKDRLVEAAQLLRGFAAGKGDAKGEARVHRLFAQAIVRAIMWGRGEDGD